MASNFPSSLDVFTNPSSTDAMDSVSVPHATQHSDLNDAVEALQAKVGADSSAVTTSLDYKIAQLEAGGSATAFTPSWASGFTAGNATQEWHYWQMDGLVYVIGQTILGSTSAVTGIPTLTLPVTRESYANPIIDVGNGSLGDSGTATYAVTIISTSTTTALFFCRNATTSYVREASTSSTVPFTWTTGDFITGTLIYKAA